MRRSQQAFSAPSKHTQSSNAKDELSSTASINASSTTLIPSSELLASKPRDSTLKREQNSCYEHDNGLRRARQCLDATSANLHAIRRPATRLVRSRNLPVAGASRPSGPDLRPHARKPDQGEMAEGRHGAALQEPHIGLTRGPLREPLPAEFRAPAEPAGE